MWSTTRFDKCRWKKRAYCHSSVPRLIGIPSACKARATSVQRWTLGAFPPMDCKEDCKSEQNVVFPTPCAPDTATRKDMFAPPRHLRNPLRQRSRSEG